MHLFSSITISSIPRTPHCSEDAEPEEFVYGELESGWSSEYISFMEL
jgi:hypothetical protein